MSRYLAGVLSCTIIFLCTTGCSTQQKKHLTIDGGNPIVYRCENNDQITARYYNISDKSLHFVKVLLPGDTEYTLPCVLSASGARYTDDREIVWWTKGSFAFLEARDKSGNWRIKYNNCKEIADK